MTVVNPKSISGINSITMASGGDDLLTIHSNNTTERVRVNNSGDVIVGSGVTLSPDGDIFATGVCTATSFSGDGSALTGIDLGAVTGATGDFSIADKIVHTGDTNTALRFPSADTVTVETGGVERLEITGTEVVFNDTGVDTDFRIEGDSDANLFKVDASADAIGVGAVPITTGPKFEVTRSTSDAFVNATDCVARLINSDTSANTNQTSLQFTTSTTSTGADSAIVSQAEDASGNSNLQFWTDTSNGMTKKLQIKSNGDLLYASSDRNYASWYKIPTNASSNSATSNTEDLIFGTAVIANTDVYNTSNGRYTAPVDGLYHIRFNGLIDNNGGQAGYQILMRKNGSTYGAQIGYNTRMSDDSPNRYQLLSGTGIMYMSAGDYATIYATAGMHTSNECNYIVYLIRGTI